MKSYSAATIRRGRSWAAAWLLVVAVALSNPGRTAVEKILAPTPWLAEYNIPEPTAYSKAARTESARQHRVLMAEAPAQLEWALQGDERAFDFSFGYLAQALAENKSNGADIFVDLVRNGDPTPLAHRRLLPREVPADREEQRLHVILPPFPAGSRLVLKVGPGDSGDNAWDWVYLVDVRFTRAPRYLPEQFPGFNRVPELVESSHTYPYQRNGVASLFQANAPARFVFNLDGTERRLLLRYGFFGGAYTNGNTTDGVRLAVAVESGGNRVQVGERLLDPMRAAADRGPQAMALDLPPGKRNAKLVLTIDPGPNGNSSWDWTYVSGFTLE